MISRRAMLVGSAVAAAKLSGQLYAGDEGTKPRIKIGQIGVGHAHATKLEQYRKLPADYEVVGIVENDPELRKRAAEQAAFGDLKWMTTEQLLNEPGLAAVLVETRVEDLLATASLCINAGKHVHLDKPAGADLGKYQQLLEAARPRQLLVQMGYMYRYSPAVIMLREFLREGWLGEVFEVHTVMSKVVGDAERRNLARFPGGIMFELGCHVIDLVIGVLGKPEAVRAFPRHAGAQDDGLMDNALAVLEYPRATASVKSSAQEVDGGARRHFVACGTRGTFHIQPLDNPAVRLTLDQPRGKYRKGTQEIALPKFTRYGGDALDMAKIIRGEKESDFSYAHDLAVQETVLRASGMGVG